MSEYDEFRARPGPPYGLGAEGDLTARADALTDEVLTPGIDEVKKRGREAVDEWERSSYVAASTIHGWLFTLEHLEYRPHHHVGSGRRAPKYLLEGSFVDGGQGFRTTLNPGGPANQEFLNAVIALIRDNGPVQARIQPVRTHKPGQPPLALVLE